MTTGETVDEMRDDLGRLVALLRVNRMNRISRVSCGQHLWR
jgi:hypothetical protein